MLCLTACSNKRQLKNEDQNNSEKIYTGVEIFPDSIELPEIKPLDERKLDKIPVSPIEIVPANKNIHVVKHPTKVQNVKPLICVLGQDDFTDPKAIQFTDSVVLAGSPQIILAKDPSVKDQNAQNFSTYNKLHGLNQSNINCLKQDSNGNLWIGTDGGVTKFDGKHFINFTQKEGLPNNVVISIFEDKKSNIWFGTYGGGVSKYDGRKFNNCSIKNGLPNADIRAILEDNDGSIWLGTYGGGIVKMSESVHNFHSAGNIIQYTSKNGLINDKVECMMKDKDGSLWIGTDSGLSKFNGKTFTNYTTKQGLPKNIIRCLMQDDKKNIWIGSEEGGVSLFTPNEQSKGDGVFTNFKKTNGLLHNIITCIIQDNAKNIWMGTAGGGVSKLTPAVTGSYDEGYFTDYSENDGLPDNEILCLTEDKTGNIWLGTGSGLAKFNGNTFTHHTSKEGLKNADIRYILNDTKGNTWMASYGDGLYCLQSNRTSFLHYIDKKGLPNNLLYSILQDKEGNLWIGSSGGGVTKFTINNSDKNNYSGYYTHFTEKDGLCNDIVYTIMQDKKNNIWFGTDNGVSKYDGKSFSNYTVKQGLSANIIWRIMEDNQSNLWFATYGGGLTMIKAGQNERPDKNKIYHFSTENGLASNTVFAIFQDKKNNFWFGTADGGISIYTPKTLEDYSKGYFTNLTVKNGLANDFVFSVLPDELGNLWFGTRFGISKISNEALQKYWSDIPSLKNENVLFKNFNYEDGFLGVGCNRNAICEDKNATIWIGANDRLTAFYPSSKLITTDTIPPNIQISNVELFNENIPWPKLIDTENSNAAITQSKDTSIQLGNGVVVNGFVFDNLSKWYGLPQNLSLAHNNNFLTFNFIGITLKGSKKVKYQYILEGLDDQWSAISNSTEAPYGNLPPGKYTFKVKAMNSDGYWSNTYDYVFRIRPPWWKTWWLRALLAIGTISLFYWFIKRRDGIKEKENKIALQMSELKLTALQSQMNPHFIFNSLNSIQNYILQQKAIDAARYLSKFSKLMRRILDQSFSNLIPLPEIIETLKMYLELESFRFNHKFTWEVSEDISIENCHLKLPPLLIQPYVENAIIHGLMPKEGDKKLLINFFIRNDELHCQIDDNGVGRGKQNTKDSNHISRGQSLTYDMLSTLKDLLHSDAKIFITDKKDLADNPSGTTINLIIPI